MPGERSPEDTPGERLTDTGAAIVRDAAYYAGLSPEEFATELGGDNWDLENRRAAALSPIDFGLPLPRREWHQTGHNVVLGLVEPSPTELRDPRLQNAVLELVRRIMVAWDLSGEDI